MSPPQKHTGRENVTGLIMLVVKYMLLTEVGQLLERNKRHKSIASLPGIT